MLIIKEVGLYKKKYKTKEKNITLLKAYFKDRVNDKAKTTNRNSDDKSNN